MCWNDVRNLKAGTLGKFITTCLIAAFLFLCLPTLGVAVEGIMFSTGSEHNTSLGTLKGRFLLENGNQISMGANNNLIIVFGIIHMGPDDATQINESIGVYTARKPTQPVEVTFVQDRKTGTWLATNGALCIVNDKQFLLDGTTIKVVGGANTPIKIAGQPFADTTVQIRDGKPVAKGISKGPSPAQRVPSGITITGVIKNLDEARQYIKEDTYLQLVRISDDGKQEFRTDGKGRIEYSSDLQKVAIADNGAFSFDVRNLEPGKYAVVVQLFAVAWVGRSFPTPIISRANKDAVIVAISENTKTPASFNFGEVYIPVPLAPTK